MALSISDLDTLDTAIATGELTVRFDSGRMVTYRSVDELLRARNHVARVVAAATETRTQPRYQQAVFDDA